MFMKNPQGLKNIRRFLNCIQNSNIFKGGITMEDIKRKKKKSKGKYILLILFILIIGFGVFANNYFKTALKPMDLVNIQEIDLDIPSGSSTKRIASILQDKGLIRNELIFQYEVKSMDLDGKLKAGKYNLNTSMDINELITSLSKGGITENTVRFTIPEGYELNQIAERLAKDNLVDLDRFLQLVNDKSNFEEEFSFLKELEEGQSLEGFLFPSTYEIFASSSEEDIINKMLVEFEKIYNNEIVSKIDETGLSLNELITLASIVEREGKLDEERPIMAGVFYNRLDQGMFLQSCATVQYILGERKEVLSIADTQTPSPFNTYTNEGLPPAPIASPGKASLVATVNPADVDYLFFVLTGDDGSHTFTKTYNEHLNAKP